MFIIVHGGAGYHSPADEKNLKEAMRAACHAAVDPTVSSLSLVERAISSLEDHPLLNAGPEFPPCTENLQKLAQGFGSNLTLDGHVECDAAIMDQESYFGSVGAVSGVKNPIQLARAILRYSLRLDPLGRVPPLTLVGPGAVQFASTHVPSVELVPPNSLVSSNAKGQWELWKERWHQATVSASEGSVLQDTVGAIAWTELSGVAAGVSSGGLLLKLPGRIGEAAVYGAGCWAQRSPMLACSISGNGELITRQCLARTICQKLSAPDIDVHDILQDELANNCEIGVVLLDLLDEKKAHLWCAFTTASMAIAYHSTAEGGEPTAHILRQSNNQSVCITAISL